MIKPIRRRIIHPFRQFLKTEQASGIILLTCTVASLIIANSAWGEKYLSFWHNEVGFKGPNNFEFKLSIEHWINDGLMAIFFLVVGLEIKRELLEGELSNFKKAILPLFAALGGMIVPAAIYASFNIGTESAQGWGIPMATDIAFALGNFSLI